MTRSAPIARSISSFGALSTAVTCAPRTLASWTANVPKLPPAPLTRTLCPLRTLAFRRNARHPNPRGEVEPPQLAIGRADRRGADSNQHFVVLRNGLHHVFELKNIRWSVARAHYCPHGSPARAFAVVRIRPSNVGRMSCRALSAVKRCDPDIHDDSLTLVHDDDDLASSVPLVQIPKGLSGLSQRIRSVDDRSDPSGLDQLLESCLLYTSPSPRDGLL